MSTVTLQTHITVDAKEKEEKTNVQDRDVGNLTGLRGGIRLRLRLRDKYRNEQCQESRTTCVRMRKRQTWKKPPNWQYKRVATITTA